MYWRRRLQKHFWASHPKTKVEEKKGRRKPPSPKSATDNDHKFKNNHNNHNINNHNDHKNHKIHNNHNSHIFKNHNNLNNHKNSCNLEKS